jgi:hypothetical protein
MVGRTSTHATATIVTLPFGHTLCDLQQRDLGGSQDIQCGQGIPEHRQRIGNHCDVLHGDGLLEVPEVEHGQSLQVMPLELPRDNLVCGRFLLR